MTNEKSRDRKTEVGVLHVGINDKNSEVNKDLAADIIILTFLKNALFIL